MVEERDPFIGTSSALHLKEKYDSNGGQIPSYVIFPSRERAAIWNPIRR